MKIVDWVGVGVLVVAVGGGVVWFVKNRPLNAQAPAAAGQPVPVAPPSAQGYTAAPPSSGGGASQGVRDFDAAANTVMGVVGGLFQMGQQAGLFGGKK